LPVYLYEAAASRPERRLLEDVRRGGYEALRDSIKTDPARQPDFGPTELGKAGAVIIGARPPLIAFNIYLNSSDVRIARQIAKAVRASSGGLRYVKALGLLVDGRAQVSLNLTDYTQTPLHRVVELVRREAARYGVAIAESELIGLIPEEALIEAARWYMQIDNLRPSQLLERRIAEADHAHPTKPDL
jgi:glutamate formiminotransferase